MNVLKTCYTNIKGLHLDWNENIHPQDNFIGVKTNPRVAVTWSLEDLDQVILDLLELRKTFHD